jgi:hypothetical protein
MLKEPEFRLCPYSYTLFIAKRQNQVFASAEDRIAFHNDQNNFLRKKLSSINKQLLKSYKVADALLVDNKEVIVHRQFLRGKGFSFQMLTHVEKQEDDIVYGLYDITFKKLNDDEYLIKRKK